MNWRDLLYFSKGERRALTLLLCLISISWIILFVTDNKPDYFADENKKVTIVELNTADTTILKKVPGIGSTFARRIIKYRELLGGFYSVSQLHEVYGIDEERYNTMKSWFSADLSLICQLIVNKVSMNDLQKHPYINYRQARIIGQLRKQKGKLTGWENFQLLEEFTDADRERLTPYLSFE